MADKNFLDDRREALEEQFFRKQNRALLDKLRDQDRQGSERAALAAASGISDEQTLERLRAQGLDAGTVAALTLFPLVEVAWADGKLEANERDALLAAAERKGIPRGSAAHALLTDWLELPPPKELAQAWQEYVRAHTSRLNATARAELAADILGCARSVAGAAGGILGVGSVSKAERAVLERLEKTFSQGG